MSATALYAERVAAAASARAQPSITSCRSSESKTQHAGECVRTAILEPMPVIGVGSGISNPGKVRPLSRGKAVIAGRQIAAPEHGTADRGKHAPEIRRQTPLTISQKWSRMRMLRDRPWRFDKRAIEATRVADTRPVRSQPHMAFLHTCTPPKPRHMGGGMHYLLIGILPERSIYQQYIAKYEAKYSAKVIIT
jgi:hypothetical protein